MLLASGTQTLDLLVSFTSAYAIPICSQITPYYSRRLSENHIATVLVILPSHRTSATLEVTHGQLKRTISLSENAAFSTHFVAMYAGIETAVVTSPAHPLYYLTYNVFNKAQGVPTATLSNLIGPCPDITRAFASWAHTLATGSKRPTVTNNCVFYHLDGTYKDAVDVNSVANRKDRLIISRLAPNAKHYGFELAIAHASIWKHCEFTIERAYKEYDLDYEREDYSMQDYDIRMKYAWQVNGLGKDQAFGDDWTRDLEDAIKSEDGIINYHVDLDDEEDAELEGIDQTVSVYDFVNSGPSGLTLLSAILIAFH